MKVLVVGEIIYKELIKVIDNQCEIIVVDTCGLEEFGRQKIENSSSRLNDLSLEIHNFQVDYSSEIDIQVEKVFQSNEF